MTKQLNSQPIIRAVDLFCGVGGLTHGLALGGVDVTAGIDLDGSCKYPYEANNQATFVQQDVNNLSADELAKLFGKNNFRLLAGCAPCQPFSTYSQPGRRGRANKDWELVASFGRLISELQPELVTMENVPQMERHSVFGEFLRSLKGYRASWKVIDCSDVGIPQTRKRFVLLASRLDANLKLHTSKQAKKTVRDAIGSLPPLSAGEASLQDKLHVACKLSNLNLKRIRASKPGGTWRDWQPSLRATCHKKSTGETYPSVYGRMEWDEPSPTITTQCFGYGNGRFGHPEQDRAITLREAAILQTFPPAYEFVGEGSRVRFSHLGRLIGNAVPVRLGEVIGRSFVRHVREHLTMHLGR